MENYTESILSLRKSIEGLIKAIDDEVDWLIASFTERDPKRKLIARTFFHAKQKEVKRLAEEAYERFK